MIDTSQLQFSVFGPYRSSDGTFQFDMVIMLPSPVIGQPADLVGRADIRVKTDSVCRGMAEALRHIADQLPPELSLAGGHN